MFTLTLNNTITTTITITITVTVTKLSVLFIEVQAALLGRLALDQRRREGLVAKQMF